MTVIGISVTATTRNGKFVVTNLQPKRLGTAIP